MKINKKRKKWKITPGKLAISLVLIYVFSAVIPYAFPPESEKAVLAAIQRQCDASPTGGEWAGILESGEDALAGRLWLIENA